MELKGSKVEEIMKQTQPTVSLETKVNYDDGDTDSELGDFVQDQKATEEVQITAENNILKEDLADVMACLTPRERKVLTLRFGLEDGRAMTLEEVGRELGVTRERIRQIEGKALRKLRIPSRSRKLKDYID